MEAFSLLKYWRGSGGGGANVRNPTTGTTTISTAISRHAAETEDDGDGDGDEGPFFDLEFAVPDEDEQEKHQDNDGDEEGEDDEEREDGVEECDGTDGENEREFKFTLSSGSSGDCTDPTVSLSPSDDLFFKGRLLPVEPSSSSESNAKPQFSLLKSATKIRVLMLKLKKSKANVPGKTEPEGSAKENEDQEETQTQTQKPKQSQPQSKFFTVKFKVEEVPIVSLFTRDNSSRASSGSSKSLKQQSSDESGSDEKRFSKDGMQKYLKMVKPLYIRVSKRYGEKLGFSGQLSLGGGTKAGPSPTPTSTPSEPQKSPPESKDDSVPAEATESQPVQLASEVKSQKQGKLPAGLRVVCKHLGKSRSASSAAVAAAPPGSTTQARRRDDSLLEQQDGIQSAILHCKRSFNASRDSESLFSRSVSDPSPKETCV